MPSTLPIQDTRLFPMALNIGSIAPDFELENQHGESVRLSEVLQKKPVALVFFPLAFSGICTGELCELQDNLSIFNDSEIELLGVSIDSKFALKAWAEKEGYDFSILADFWPHGGVAKLYDVFVDDLGFANRATFVIGQDQIIKSAIVTAPGEARDFSAYKVAVAELAG